MTATASGRRPSPEETRPGLAVRQAASRLLGAVVDKHTPLDGLVDPEHGHGMFLALSERDRALGRAILRTALRFRGTIALLLRARLEKDLPPNAAALQHLLHVAAAQILFLDVPAHAAVDGAVAQAKADPRTARFAALVNGVLRSLLRAKDAELGPALALNRDAPLWFADRLREAYGAEAGAILAMHRVEAPTDFTVKADAEMWAERFGAVLLPTGSLRLRKLPGAVPDLPGFAEGAWWVQDAAAALPARLMGDIRGQRVADLCAAPGGKTAQLALAGARVTALDASRSRLKRLRGNLARLRLEAETVEADILQWQPPAGLFDAVLLDAPCSSTGTVRRHPDIPWTKSPADIEALAGLQRRLLDRAAGFVKPGGRVVFSNCSLDPREGERLLADFLAQTPAMRLDPIGAGEAPDIAPFLAPDGTLRTTPADMGLGGAPGSDGGDPGLSGLDGFFAARLVRVS